MSRGRKRIYFMHAVNGSGPIKIGCSGMPDDRLREMSQWSPFALRLLATGDGDHKLEACLHRMFKDRRSHGEWFVANYTMLEAISAVAAGVSVEEAFGIERRTRQRYGKPVPVYSPTRDGLAGPANTPDAGEANTKPAPITDAQDEPVVADAAAPQASASHSSHAA